MFWCPIPICGALYPIYDALKLGLVPYFISSIKDALCRMEYN
jgi:hypothetical protein